MNSTRRKLLFPAAKRGSPCLDTSMADKCRASGNHVIQWIQQGLSPGGTVFDVGSHYGCVSIAAANCVRAHGRVPGEVILQAVRWYLRYPLAYEHVAELLAERGLAVDASCVWRWVQAYSPELNNRCRSHLKRTNKSLPCRRNL
jgi:hypothetical protein